MSLLLHPGPAQATWLSYRSLSLSYSSFPAPTASPRGSGAAQGYIIKAQLKLPGSPTVPASTSASSKPSSSLLQHPGSAQATWLSASTSASSRPSLSLLQHPGPAQAAWLSYRSLSLLWLFSSSSSYYKRLRRCSRPHHQGLAQATWLSYRPS